MAMTVKGTFNITTDGTAQTIIDTADLGVYDVNVDLTNMVAGDEFEVQISKKLESGGAYVVVETTPLGPSVPDDKGLQTIPYTAPYGFKATLKKTVGSATVHKGYVGRVDA